jgi:hypothetical protein
VIDEIHSWELHLWAQELREAAIVLAVLGLLMMLSSRGALLLPGLLVTAALVTVDSMVDAVDAGGPAVLTGLFGLGTTVVAAGWWLGGFLAGRGASRGIAGPEVRRRLAGVAAVAALCAPALFFHATSGSPTPAGFPAGTAVAAGMLAVVAGVAATAARPDGLPIAVAAPVVGAPALLMTTAGLGAGTTGELWYVVPLGLPFAAFTLAIVTMRAGRRSVLRWVATGLVAVALSMPLVLGQLVLAQPVGTRLMQAAGYGTVDGMPLLPGAVIAGALLAALFAVRVAPRSGDVPQQRTAPSEPWSRRWAVPVSSEKSGRATDRGPGVAGTAADDTAPRQARGWA